MKPDAAMVVTTRMAESLGVGGAGNTATTNTLTPTTLRSITQIFESDDCLQDVKRIDEGCFVPPAVTTAPSTVETNKTSFVNRDSKSGWHGGTTTVLTPSKVIPHIAVLIQDGVDEEQVRKEQEEQKRKAAAMVVATKTKVEMGKEDGNNNNSRLRRSSRINNGNFVPTASIIEREMPPTETKSKKKGGRKPRSTGGRRPGDEYLTPEEFQKISVRRLRNKEAAARCRKRRVDLTNDLMEQVEDHEAKKRALEEEIQMLKGQKEELEFILQAHASHCKLQMPPMTTSAAPVPTSLVVAVKSEPAPVVSSSNVVVEAADAPYSLPQPVQINAGPAKRPATLSISPSSSSVTASEAGIVIETPSTAIPCLAFESVTTGLTPCAPAVSSIATPTVTLNTPITCSAQQRSSDEQINSASPDYVSL